VLLTEVLARKTYLPRIDAVGCSLGSAFRRVQSAAGGPGHVRETHVAFVRNDFPLHSTRTLHHLGHDYPPLLLRLQNGTRVVVGHVPPRGCGRTPGHATQLDALLQDADLRDGPPCVVAADFNAAVHSVPGWVAALSPGEPTSAGGNCLDNILLNAAAAALCAAPRAQVGGLCGSDHRQVFLLATGGVARLFGTAGGQTHR